MDDKSIIIIEVCAFLALVFAFVGICGLMVGSHRARRAFRVKGYLKPPKGRGWIWFLLIRQYESFDDADIQASFRLAHFCLLALLIDLGAIIILSTCEILLRMVASGGPVA